MLGEKASYKASAFLYFSVTFTIIGFAIVSLVQGIRMQFSGNTPFALALYISAPLLVFASYMSFQKAYYKLRVLSMARR